MRLLKIREAQRQALCAPRDPAFRARLAAWLRRRNPPAIEQLSDAQLDQRLAVLIERARHHGFHRQSSLAFFAAVALEISPSFDEAPGLAEALSHRHGAEAERIERFLTHTSEADWQAAVALRDADHFEVVLERLAHRHADGLRALLPERPEPPIPPDLDPWLEAMVRSAQRGLAHTFAIRFANQLIGTCGLVAMKDGSAQLTYWIGARFRGRGHATDAAAKLLRLGFGELGLRTVTTLVQVSNSASARVLAKLGALRAPARDRDDLHAYHFVGAP